MSQDKTDTTPTEPGEGYPASVRFSYEGKPWTAERNYGSMCSVTYRNPADDRDGMAWSAPTEEIGSLQWRILHFDYQPTRTEMLGLLSVIDSFRSLLFKEAKQLRVIAKSLRDVLEAEERPAEEEADNPQYQQFLEQQLAETCSCCPDCGDVPCGGCMAGAPCDDRCACSGWGDEDAE